MPDRIINFFVKKEKKRLIEKKNQVTAACSQGCAGWLLFELSPLNGAELISLLTEQL